MTNNTVIIKYEVVGKAFVERGGGLNQHSLNLIYRGDGTPWWVVTSGLSLTCTEDFYNAARIGDFVSLGLTLQEQSK